MGDLLNKENFDLGSINLTRDQIARLINQTREHDTKVNELKRKLMSAEMGHENSRQVLETYRDKCN